MATAHSPHPRPRSRLIWSGVAVTVRDVAGRPVMAARLRAVFHPASGRTSFEASTGPDALGEPTWQPLDGPPEEFIQAASMVLYQFMDTDGARPSSAVQPNFDSRRNGEVNRGR